MELGPTIETLLHVLSRIYIYLLYISTKPHNTDGRPITITITIALCHHFIRQTVQRYRLPSKRWLTIKLDDVPSDSTYSVFRLCLSIAFT